MKLAQKVAVGNLRTKEENYSYVKFVIIRWLGHQSFYRVNTVSRDVIDFLKNSLTSKKYK